MEEQEVVVVDDDDDDDDDDEEKDERRDSVGTSKADKTLANHPACRTRRKSSCWLRDGDTDDKKK